MSDVVRLERGSAPWLPSADSTAVVEYRYHDVPLEGVIQQHGVQFLFQCLNGSEGTSWWIYTLTDNSERAAIERCPSLDDYEHLMRNRPLHAPFVVALAFEDVGIVAFRTIEDDSVDAGNAALAAIKAEIAEFASEAQEFELTTCRS